MSINYVGRVNWSDLDRKPSAAQGQQQAQRNPVGPSRGSSAGGAIQSIGDSINRLRQEQQAIDREIAKLDQERRTNNFGAKPRMGVSGSAEYQMRALMSRKSVLDADIRDKEANIADIQRSREEVAQSGGYGEGGFGSALQRGIGQARSTMGAIGAMVGDVEKDDVEDIVRGRAQVEAAPRNRAEQEAYERFQAADGFIASAREIFTNPRLLANVAIESIPSSGLSILGGTVGAAGGAVAGGAAGGPAGALIGGRVGGGLGAGAGSFVVEYGNAMLETMQRNGVDLDDPAALEAAINSPEIMAEARDRGLRRGIAVGAFDALSAGLAGKLGGSQIASRIIGETGEAGVGRRVAGTLAGGVAETGSQGLLGGSGEAAGQLATDGKITSPQDIVAEFAGEIPGGMIESTVGTGAEVLAGDRRSKSQQDGMSELGDAIATVRGGDTQSQETLALPSPERLDLDGADNETTLKAGGLNLTPRQLIERAQQNSGDPRIADIMSQPIDPNTKAAQIARVLNEREAARIEPDLVRRVASLAGGTIPVSRSKAFIADELARVGDEVVEQSATLRAIRDTVNSNATGKQYVGTLRGIVDGYRAPVENQTFFARPERGGEGSVIMTNDQVADEAKREREAQQAFRMAERRQQRFDAATGQGTQREDIRPGAPEPQAEFFLGDAYGDLAGTAATIVESANPGFFRVQYESPNEVGPDGTPVTISEEVNALDLIGRVVRGTPRMTQELAGNVRKPKRGTGTDMNPRQSVDRTSTRAIAEAQQPQPPMVAPVDPNLTMTGRQEQPYQYEAQPSLNAQEMPVEQTEADVQGTVESANQISGAPGAAALPAPPRGLPAPEAPKRRTPPPPVTEREETAPKAPAEETNLTEQEVDEEDMLDVEEHPRMVEHNQRYDDALELVQEAENATDVRKIAKRLIREGVIDADDYSEIDSRMKDVPNAERFDEGMSALEEAIDQQRDNVGTDIADEIRQEDSRYYSKRVRRQIVRPDQRAGAAPQAKPAAKEGAPLAGEASTAPRRVELRANKDRQTAPQPATEAPVEDAKVGEAQKIIDAFVEKLKARGKDGRVAAIRFTQAMKDRRLTNDQVFAAAKALEVASRMGLKGADIQLVNALFDENGEAVQGYYDATETTTPGFVGVIKLSLAPQWTSMMTETAAHEVFHGLQKLLALHDQKSYRALMAEFPANKSMTIDDIPASIKRILRGTKVKGLGGKKKNWTYWQLMMADPVFRQGQQEVTENNIPPLRSWSGTKGNASVLELQAYVMGYLHDAIQDGAQVNTLANSFRNAMSFWIDLTTKLGNALRGNGFTSAKQIFIDAIEGKLADRLGDVRAVAGDGVDDVQYSARRVAKPDYSHPEIGKQLIGPPIPATSTIPYLYNNGKNKPEQTPSERMDLKDTVQFIQDRSRAALKARFGVDRITGSSPETDRYLMRAIASEAEAAILKERATGNRSALDWYTKAIEDAVEEAAVIYPMLRDDGIANRLSNRLGIKSKEDARVMFTLALSITSQNMKVRDNARATTEQFDIFLETGRFDPTKKYGTKAPSISSNLALANYMLEQAFRGKVETLGRFLNTEFTVAELNAVGRKMQIKDGLDKPPFKISGELATEKVYGSAIFGPKIGNGFYQNLNRNFSPVTIDLWFMRLWGRLTGTLVGNEAALSKQIASLREAVEADSHPTVKVPDGYIERFSKATDDEVIGLGIELAADWERQYKAFQKQGMSSDEITERGLKPDWAYKAVALAGQLKPNDVPGSGSSRKWIRDVVAGAVKILAKNGYDVTPADLQALVWYPEKDLINLFKEGKLEANLNVSYDTAFSELAAARNNDATPTNTDGRDGGGDGAPRLGDGRGGSGQANVEADAALVPAADGEEGDQVRRSLPSENRERLIERGTLYSARRSDPRYTGGVSQSMMDKVVAEEPNPGVFGKFLDNLVGRQGNESRRRALVRNVVNDKDGVLVLDKMLDAAIRGVDPSDGRVPVDGSSVGRMMEMASQSAGVMQAALELGPPVFDGEITTISEDIGGLFDIFLPIGEERAAAFQTYAVARRESDLRRNGRIGFTELTDAEIAETLRNADADFAEVFEAYQEYNGAIIDYAVDTGLLTEELGEKLKSMDYVPYYRAYENDDGELDVLGPKMQAAINNPKSGLDLKLKGGSSNLGNLYENIIRNTNSIISAARKNLALQEAADTIDALNELGMDDVGRQVSTPEGKGIMRLRIDGKPVYYQIEDLAVWAAIASLGPQQRNILVEVGAKFADIVRTGITLATSFMLANLWRGKISAYVTTDANLSLGIDTFKGMKDAYTSGEATQIIKANTGIGGYTYGMGETDFANEIRRRYRRSEGGGYGFARDWLDRFKGVLVAAEKVGEATELAERVKLYNDILANGGSHKTAAYEAMNLTNFGRKGAGQGYIGATLNVLVPMIPFLNARIQGLYRIVENQQNEATIIGLRKKVLLRGMLYTLAASAIYAMFSDDDRWDEETVESKMLYDIMYIGNVRVVLPRPFEVGTIFGSLPIAMFDYIRDQDGSEAAKKALFAFTNTFAMNPIPQGAKPALEAFVNYSFFRGGAIDTMADQSLPAEMRYDERTTETAKAIGGVAGVSPKKVDYVLNGYFGTLGAGFLAGVDTVLSGMGFIPKKAGGIFGDPYHIGDAVASASGITRFVGDSDRAPSRFVRDFYELKREADQAHRAHKQLVQEQKFEEAKELLEENKAPLAARKQLGRIAKKITSVNKKMDAIHTDPKMTPAEKTLKLKPLILERKRLARAGYDYARAMKAPPQVFDEEEDAVE